MLKQVQHDSLLAFCIIVTNLKRKEVKMNKIRKDVGVKVVFDDKDYSYEETILLYQQFFETLAGIARVNLPKNFAECIYPREHYEKNKTVADSNFL